MYLLPPIPNMEDYSGSDRAVTTYRLPLQTVGIVDIQQHLANLDTMSTLVRDTLVSRAVRPGTAGLLIGIEYSKVRDNSWMYLTSFVTIRIGVELAALQRKLPSYVVVRFQRYPARTFHVTLSPPDI